jgi:hypothetical protein
MIYDPYCNSEAPVNAPSEPVINSNTSKADNMAQSRITQLPDCSGPPLKKELGNSSLKHQAPDAKHDAVAHPTSGETKRWGVVSPNEAFSLGERRRHSVDNGIWNADEEFGNIFDIVPNSFLANERA